MNIVSCVIVVCLVVVVNVRVAMAAAAAAAAAAAHSIVKLGNPIESNAMQCNATAKKKARVSAKGALVGGVLDCRASATFSPQLAASARKRASEREGERKRETPG